MTGTMIYRIARAIFEVEYPNGEVDEYRWERSSDVYLDQARAAVKAMRDPIPEMKIEFEGWNASENEMEACYKAAVEAALKE